jgi:hypothetical protein
MTIQVSGNDKDGWKVVEHKKSNSYTIAWFNNFLQVQKFLNKLGVGDNYIWWLKALPYKNLGRGGAPAFDVSIYDITTYDELANTMPISRKMMESFVKISWQ